MTDTGGKNGGLMGKETSETGAIIDASARRRPRVHELEADPEKDAVGVDFLGDVPLNLNVILGVTTMSLGEIIALETDSIVQLEKPSGDPMDIYVEDRHLGNGEVVVLHEKIRIRVLEITSPSEDAKTAEAK